jgi:sugar O-acyltransferase (sialic acid O-acetyltransferase NeuD family)
MPIVVFGCGGRMIVDIEESCARLGIEIAAIVKNFDGPAHALAPERIVDADDIDEAIRGCPYVIPFFSPGHRFAAHRDAVARGFRRAATIVDPTAAVARSATAGGGTYVNAGAVIGGAARLGAFVFINRSANIGHDVEIDDFASVAPGATICGGVRLGRGAVVAAGAIVCPDVRVGANSVIAAGAVVRESVADHCLVVGNPARIVDRQYPGFRSMSIPENARLDRS